MPRTHPPHRPNRRPAPPLGTPLVDSHAPSLRPAVRRTRAEPVSTRTAIARVLAEVPWHPYVWLYRTLFIASAVTLCASLLVFAAPTWSNDVSLFLGDLDRTNGYQLPSFLLFMAVFGTWCGVQVFQTVVRLGQGYPPLPDERTERPAG